MTTQLVLAANMLAKRERAPIVAATGLVFEVLKKTSKAIPLKDVLISYKGGTWGENTVAGVGFPVLRSSDMRGTRVDVSSAQWCSIPMQRAESFSLQDGDILVTKSSGSSDLVGKSALFLDPHDGNTYLFSNFTLRIRPDKKIVIPEYLGWFLRSPQALMWRYEKQQNAVGLRNLQTQEYLNQLIPTPTLLVQEQLITYLSLLESEDVMANNTPLPLPLDEQRRIVARIEALAGRVSEAQRLREEAVKEAELLLNSSLSQITKDLLASHQPTSLENLTIFIGDMNHEMPIGQNEGIPFISPKDFVENGEINFQDAKKITSEDFERLSKKCCPQYGDILMARYGTIGAARYVETSRDFLASYSIAVIRPNPKAVSGKFLYWMAISPYVQEQAIKGIRGSGMADLGLKTIRQFEIPQLDFNEQDHIVAYLNGLQAQIDILHQQQSVTQQELNALIPSILDRAFKGEL